jgi:hypothetical protein
MLDEREFEAIADAYQTGTRGVKLARALTDRPLSESNTAGTLSEVAARYFEITGVSDVDPQEVLRHRLSRLGPACGKCGKERRSPLARKCLECGHEGD